MVLFLATRYLVVAVQPCMEWILIKKKLLSQFLSNIQVILFFYLVFGCPTVNFGPLLVDSHTHLMLVTAFVKFWPKGHQKSHNDAGSLSWAKCLVGFELLMLRHCYFVIRANLEVGSLGFTWKWFVNNVYESFRRKKDWIFPVFHITSVNLDFFCKITEFIFNKTFHNFFVFFMKKG